MLYPGPTPTSTPTTPSDIAKAARNQGGSLSRISCRLANSVDSCSVSSVYSSATILKSPVLWVLLNETENQQNSAEISANLLANYRMNAGQNINSGQAVSGSVDLASDESSEEH